MEINDDIAELIGIILGDGNITYSNKKNDVKYRLVITGHSINDYDYLNIHVRSLILRLFNKKVGLWKHKNKNAIALAVYSKEILSYLIKNFKLKPGPKINLVVPQVILRSNKNIKASFLRGIADTDFSICFKRKRKNVHYYPVIEGSTNSLRLAEQIVNILKDFKIKANIYQRRVRINDSLHIIYNLDIYGKKNLALWMKNIGFNNIKHSDKISIWRRKGYYKVKKR